MGRLRREECKNIGMLNVHPGFDPLEWLKNDKTRQVKTRGLRFRARFKRDETRRDWRAIPESAGLGQDYFFMLGKIREKNGKKTRWEGTTHYYCKEYSQGL